MRQRAALVQALLSDRPIVLLDEPFAAMDRVMRHRMQDLTRQALAGCTVLHVTGDPMEAVRFADRILVLEGQPARIHDFDPPPGKPLRPDDEPAVAAHAEALLQRLLNRPA